MEPRMGRIRSRPTMGVAGVIALFSCLTAQAAPPAEAAASAAQSAAWTQKQLTFDYFGFTSKYSCDGLRDRMRSILLTLGARPDLKVQEAGCIRWAGPDPFPGVRITMSVLQPAAANAGQADVAAHWKRVDLVSNLDPLDAAGQCELIEQVKQHVLPLFVTRNVDYSATCVPNQLFIGDTRLRADVLVADAPAPATAQAK
jgi:hypothetical protein